MGYIHLVIKGGIEEAEHELHKRGIDAAYVEYNERYGACTYRANELGNWGRVAAWYNEAESSPYPDGTLLFFAFKQDKQDFLGTEDLEDTKCPV